MARIDPDDLTLFSTSLSLESCSPFSPTGRRAGDERRSYFQSTDDSQLNCEFRVQVSQRDLVCVMGALPPNPRDFWRHGLGCSM